MQSHYNKVQSRETTTPLVARVAAWVVEAGPGTGPVGAITPLRGGTQNVLLRIERGDTSFVLRGRRGPVEAAAAGTVREASVLRALGPTPVPCPGIHAVVADAGAIGLPFYVSDHVDGFNPIQELPAAYDDPSARLAAGLRIVEAIADLGSIDLDAVGLGGLGRPEGFLERQVERWRRQHESYVDVDGYTGTTPDDIGDVAEWLDRNRPTGGEPGLLHGDCHLANMLLRRDRPEVAALVDWELATVGDPLLDLGTLLATWPLPDGPRSILDGPLVEAGGLAGQAELVEHYARRSTRDLSAVEWYVVLACYRLGILLEGSLARAAAGTGSPAVGGVLHRSALALFARARYRARLPTGDHP